MFQLQRRNTRALASSVRRPAQSIASLPFSTVIKDTMAHDVLRRLAARLPSQASCRSLLLTNTLLDSQIWVSRATGLMGFKNIVVEFFRRI